MKTLVIGRNGQVGWELSRSMLPLGNIVAVGRGDADFSLLEGLRGLVREIRPDVIINAAAYTAVDQAEKETELAFRINGDAPGVIAQEAKRLGALLVHYSTDYVFDGAQHKPYTEDDIPNPQSAYGRSKLAGERAIQESGCDYLILRTSWVYGTRGKNFLKTILRLGAEREQLRVVADQIGTPNWARLIADTTAHVTRQAGEERAASRFASGVFNLTASGDTSWHGFADAIVAGAREYVPAGFLCVTCIEAITTEEYPLPAPRPKNSRLSGDNLERRFGIRMPTWRTCLSMCLEDIFAAVGPASADTFFGIARVVK